jgi:small-conductance mechanosensitive channel
MKTSQKWTLIGLLGLVAVAVAGLFLTPGAPNLPGRNKSAKPATAGSEQIDQHYLETARQLSALAITPEEQQLAQAVLRVADRELDLELAAALEATGNQSVSLSPEARAFQQRIERIQTAILARQEKVKQLAEAVKNSRGDKQEVLQQQLDVSQAELDLYKEGLADAKEDLFRAGGDPHSKVQQLVEEHKAAANRAESVQFVSTNQTTPRFSSDSLLAKWSRWSAIRRKQDQLRQAQQEALSAAAARARDHDALAQQLEKEQAQSKGLTEQVTNAFRSGNQNAAPPVAPDSRETTAAAVALLQHLSAEQKSLAILNKRIQDFQEVGSSYGQWIVLVNADRRSALHDIILSALWIFLLLLVPFLINRLIDRFLVRMTLEQKQQATLHAVVRFSLQALAVLVILFVIFGVPSQLSTIIGLATAGLTVALKDFIVSFMGWFVLMGRNGIRVGERVEIKGVRGEVVEIGLLRTILLETGNWTDAGQPTGRQVAFLNSFAVEGYYFNFSTSGQWLWDQLHVLVAVGQDPYPLIEKIRDIVANETKGNAQLAEKEWQSLSPRYGVRSFSDGPTVNVKPTDHGVDLIVRYIIRAAERSDARYRLNHAVVKLLHQGAEIIPSAEIPPDPPVAGLR